jgi:hypothetical protein
MVSISDVPGRDAIAVGPISDVFGEDLTKSAVSWGAIIAGAVTAIAVTVILLVLGTGVGLSMVSPWYGVGASAATVGVSAVIWLVIVQWLSSGIGGYITGRLRTKWVRVHTHEVFFRDTAHGFLAWSLASVVGALMFASATVTGVTGMAKGTADAVGTAASGAAEAGVQHGQAGINDSGYFVDTLFRSTNADGAKSDPRPETTSILAESFHDGQVVLSPADKTYLAQMVASRTGISQPDAEQRVDTVVKQLNDAQQKLRATADQARKRAAQLSIATALAMLVGAFIASAAAALGGSIRDE